jgi:carbamoyl-phosphate synthase small subunit
LGHQILGIALGIGCGKLKFGHHGANHPVKDLEANKVSITSQNHNYALDRDEIPTNVELTHINLNDNTVEGIKHSREPLFSVQYHPEAAPGPNDSTGLFEKFKNLMER